MKALAFVSQSYFSASPYDEVIKLKGSLIEGNSIVVKSKGKYLGLITQRDLLERSYNLIIDYLSPKPCIDAESKLDQTLKIMQAEALPALPVKQNGQFIGVIYKEDILREKNKILAKHKQATADIIHDISGQIAVVTLLLEVLKQEETGQKKNEALNTLKKVTDQTIRLSRAFQSAEKFEQQKNEITNNPVDLNQTVRKMILLKKLAIETNGINLKTKIENTPYVKKINELSLERIIQNLIANAIKFTPQKGTITVETKTTNNHWQLVIKDTGIGINKEDQKELFKRYSSSSRRGLRGEESTGLGLHICKKNAEELNGTIKVITKENKGTSFVVTICKVILTF